MNGVLTLMMGVGLFIGFVILGFFVWGAKQGQFDDNNKMMGGLLFDSQEDLNDAVQKENKKKQRKNSKEKKLGYTK